MTQKTRQRISTLAEYAFDALRPNPRNDSPHAVERVFRESVKAVKDANTLQIRVTGRLQKLPDRTDHLHRVSGEKSEQEGTPNERIEAYAEYFVDEILIRMYDGKPSLLKRDANNLADGFYAATLRLQREEYGNEKTSEATPAS